MCLYTLFRNGHNILFYVLYFLYHVFVYFGPVALYFHTIKLFWLYLLGTHWLSLRKWVLTQSQRPPEQTAPITRHWLPASVQPATPFSSSVNTRTCLLKIIVKLNNQQIQYNGIYGHCQIMDANEKLPAYLNC